MYRTISLKWHIMVTSMVLTRLCSCAELKLPLVYAYDMPAKDFTLEEFIDVSYQPVLISKALGRNTLEKTAPWNFAHLSTSLEAATTFCTVASGSHNANIKKEEEREPEDSGSSLVEMSLRRFGLEGSGMWEQAFTNLTKDMGVIFRGKSSFSDELKCIYRMLIKVPRFIEDFEFDAVKRVGLHYTRAGWTAAIDTRSRSFFSASVVCLLEGHLSTILTPFNVPWNHMECDTDSCKITSTSDETLDIGDAENQMFLVRVDMAQRDCLFVPMEWAWRSAASTDSVSLRIMWEEDISIQEDVLQDLFLGDIGITDDEVNIPVKEDLESRSRSHRRKSKTLWEVLPKTLHRSSPLLWSSENPLLHLVKFYLLSSQRRNLTTFLHDFRVDRIILPDLVDCPKECQAAAKNIFSLLDTDNDGVLSAQDALYLTQALFDTLSSELDDLMDELRDLGVEQWSAVANQGGGRTSDFLERAKDRMVEGVKVNMRRWVEDDIDEDEEKIMKENLPGLYQDVLAAKKTKLGSKEEL